MQKVNPWGNHVEAHLYFFCIWALVSTSSQKGMITVIPPPPYHTG
ncbi:hypothetical protein BROSI_A1966 [Candidatus Brocadia sinica JPN1]|uniref:Uncharacterized protein n=1 Tax=Candidatus Brocadia sinica JPN1 TaxID=1197129 RepID=A0ABQ0JXH8_9BACT|nr:hypothetical protein BROSI_A1966 [Candidatus Brocadia sinica JPN1]